MKLSIIIPVYNAGKFLKRCLDSVLKQSIEEKEIICIDDGSTDDSLRILQEYAEEYANIYVLKQENKFAGNARNYGLSIAKGEYIHFLDADDYILSDVYSQIYAVAAKMDADYIKTRNIAFDMNSGKTIDVPAYTLKELNIHYFNQLLSLNEHPEMLLYNSVTPWCGWVKRNYILEKKIKFNDLKCVNDRSFYVEVISNTDRIVFVDYYMVAHQINNGESLVGKSNTNYIYNLKSYQIIKNKMRRFPDNTRKKIMTVELFTVLKAYGNLTEQQKEENNTLLKNFFKDFNWEDIHTEILLCPVTKYVAEKFEININEYFDTHFIINSIADLENCLKNKEYIVLYGAGKVCRALVEYIKNRHLTISLCVVVSDTSNNPDYVCGIPVKKNLKEVLDNAQEIIIAVLENVQLSIYFHLIYAGYKNIQVISNVTYNELLCENQNYQTIKNSL